MPNPLPESDVPGEAATDADSVTDGGPVGPAIDDHQEPEDAEGDTPDDEEATAGEAADPVRAVLEAAGFPEFSSTPLLDLTWEALYAALVFLPVPILELLKLGHELYGQPNEPEKYEGYWTLFKLIKARDKLPWELLNASDTEAKLTLDEPDPYWEPPPPSWLDEASPVQVPFERTDRELARMGVVAVLAYDLVSGGLTPKRFLCCALLVTVVDPRFSVLRCLLKGDQLRAAADGLEGIGGRLRMLLLELRFADEPSPDRSPMIHAPRLTQMTASSAGRRRRSRRPWPTNTEP